MSNIKTIKLLCLAGLLALSALSLLACSAPATGYKPSGLPGSIAFASNRDNNIHIYTIKPDGTDIRSTSSDNKTVDGLPRWSPDGSKIAFSSDKSGNFQIWTMNADGSERRKLTSLPGNCALPRWSPDGSKIAFTSQVLSKEDVLYLEIFAMNADGGDVRQLTDGSTWPVDEEQEQEPATAEGGHSHGGRIVWNSVPTWSPDSSKILFSSNRDGDAISPVLYIMNADGSDQRKFGLLIGVDGSEPDWSPVTDKIVCVRGSAAKGDIWVMDAAFPFPTLTARQITDNIDDNRNPVWSPDGTQIVFASDADGKKNLYIMNTDGSNIRRLTYGEAININPSWR